MLYAEDTNNFMESKTISDLDVLENQAVKSYSEWATYNRLTVEEKNALCNISKKTKNKLPAHSESLQLDIVREKEYKMLSF